MKGFNPSRLSIARQRRRYTKKALAEAINISPLTITRLEKGENIPEEATLKMISSELQFPIGFFYGDDVEGISREGVSFRSLSRLSSRDKEASIALGEIGVMFSDWVERKINTPNVDLPNFSVDFSPESAAESLREHWGLGNRPVADIVKLMESKGIFVFSLNEDIKTVDAFSFWRGDRPFVFLNTFKTVERSRFDAAHELGHLVMHISGRFEHGKQVEREADSFASCFLMPESDVKSNISRNTTLSSLVAQKTRWKTSVSALAYRLHKLELLTEWQFRSLCIQINKQYGVTEPNSVGCIESTLWKKVFTELWNNRKTKKDIAGELAIPLSQLEKLVSFRLFDKDAYKDISALKAIN